MRDEAVVSFNKCIPCLLILRQASLQKFPLIRKRKSQPILIHDLSAFLYALIKTAAFFGSLHTLEEEFFQTIRG